MSEFNFDNIPLGKDTNYAENYDKSLLFRIPREENRIQYQIENSNLPFVGFDIWNCYELSFQTDNGLPLSYVLKIVYPADSEFLVESKSLKLYLNSFNMDRFGKSIAEATTNVKIIIETDLREFIETNVQIALFNEESKLNRPFEGYENLDLYKQISTKKLESIQFTKFKESPDLLISKLTNTKNIYQVRSDVLRSNCRVTNQPDWGDLYMYICTKHQIDLSSVLEYLISFRKENHFHEEVVEMIYKRFFDKFAPDELMVAAMYTRRGGIDINPIRASNVDLINKTMIDPNCRIEKTLRQ